MDRFENIFGYYCAMIMFFDLITIILSLKIAKDIYVHEEARIVSILLYLPLIFYSFLNSLGFVLQNMIRYTWDSTCSSYSIIIVTHLASFGTFGIIPSLLVGVYIPYLVFKRSERLNLVTTSDVLTSFLVTFILTLISWGAHTIIHNVTHLYPYYGRCVLDFGSATFIICFQTILAAIALLLFFLRGLQYYFQSMLEIEHLAFRKVMKMARESICSEDFGFVNTQIVGRVSVLDDEHVMENLQVIRGVVTRYEVYFNRIWQLLLANFVIFAVLNIFDTFTFDYGNHWFSTNLIYRCCGFWYCYKFFQLNNIRGTNVMCIPNVCNYSSNPVVRRKLNRLHSLIFCNGNLPTNPHILIRGPNQTRVVEFYE